MGNQRSKAKLKCTTPAPDCSLSSPYFVVSSRDRQLVRTAADYIENVLRLTTRRYDIFINAVMLQILRQRRRTQRFNVRSASSWSENRGGWTLGQISSTRVEEGKRRITVNQWENVDRHGMRYKTHPGDIFCSSPASWKHAVCGQTS